MQRRERTRRLIELGGLVQKAGLAELVDDDRAALYGAFLEIADQLGNGDGAHVRELWRRRGKRTFESEANARSQPFVAVTE